MLGTRSFPQVSLWVAVTQVVELSFTAPQGHLIPGLPMQDTGVLQSHVSSPFIQGESDIPGPLGRNLSEVLKLLHLIIGPNGGQ